MQHLQPYENINRVELIVNGRRTYTTWNAKEVMIDLQDSDRTLKIFVKLE